MTGTCEHGGLRDHINHEPRGGQMDLRQVEGGKLEFCGMETSQVVCGWLSPSDAAQLIHNR